MRAAYFPLIGRLGNLMFQYAFSRAWCEQNNSELCLDPWIGEKVFQIPEALRREQLKAPHIVTEFPEAYYQDQASLIYTRKQVKEWFKFKPEILMRLQNGLGHNIVETCAKLPQIILNVRQGEDYKGAGLVRLTCQCYLDACGDNGYDIEAAKFETDTYPTRLPGFDGDISASGQGVTMVALPSFYRLMTAPVLFRANSSFSWWAATLAENQRVFSPVIKGLPSGDPVYCSNFTEGNWPQMTTSPINTDLHLRED